MMPAASTKPEKTSTEEPIKQVLGVVEKKVRNLEKRKSKLDGYKLKAKQGTALEKDQQAAVDKYEEVIQNLEFARELQKQFQSISTDAEKMMKKQAKREKIERQNMVLKRIQEMLKVQNLLDNLGSEKVRGDFQTGKHGAVVLTEDNLTHLDELYKLISPSRDGESNYQEKLNAAADHILALIDAREKEVVGTTYKELKELIDLIDECGYFENAMAFEEEAQEESKSVVEQDFAVVSPAEVPVDESEEVQDPLQPQTENQQLEQNTETSHDITPQQPEFNTPAEADSFFSKSAPVSSVSVTTASQQQTSSQQQHHQQQNVSATDAYSQRPFQDIVSSVQGSFNFLQESTIDMECKRDYAPHMDPAVVAAHPMPPAALGHPSDNTPNLPTQTFTNQGFGDLQSQTLDPTSSSTPSEPQGSSLLSQNQPPSVSSLSGATDYTSQTFGQGSLSQSLQNDSLFQSSSVDDASSQLPQSVLGQTSDNNMSAFELPQSIPMPPGHDSSTQEASSAESQEQKKFQMNPNAEMFQSQLYNASNSQQQSHFGQQQGEFGRSNYQGNNYQQSGYRGSRGGSGGFRGKGNSRGGERGVSNGFGSRGGRGGNSYSSGNRGGFQSGFSQRNNEYRSDNSYQNYNGNFGNNNQGTGFQKRGGGGPPRGNSRGGVTRGGPQRGGPRGGRGGQGGFGRPNSGQQQAAFSNH